ncbi:GNAT family N-acetyltransferase [Lentzea sp. BCCO 10_0798]|uniref:GNAT family N-acetyltransferase n=1 Tax=Lentzea kristufekii TaxID=3095430 RepID=A0ABU4U817_9PSEU|nr:GNAT family N-acetyltransferase [Lentzea sp. BCCO 10_0798]MDX8056737.1 GNAT family N-acetyltransferase [Lentzea sp. BCCO 10_0798]
MHIREFTEDDRDAVFRLRRVAFNGTKPSGPLLRPGSHGLLAEIDGRVAGVLGIGSYAQFYGGAAVPMGGIGGVAVDGAYRGRGIANALLDAALITMREHGQPLSVLYATVPTLYRRRGWERTGVLEWVELPMDRLLTVAKPAEPIPSRPAEQSDLPALHECYLEVARTIDGMADRRPPRMDVDKVLEMDLVTVLPGPNGLRGYLTATREPGGDMGRLKVHDLIGVDVDAQLTLLASLASWAGTLEAVDLRITDPATLNFLGGTPLRYSVSTSTWMQRVVDLPAAVAARGWPRLANAAVDLEVVDDHAPWHAGLQRVVVEDGSVRVEPGGTGAVRLHARALGPWFSGAQNTHALRRAGLLEGDPADAVVLDQLTGASGIPRLADFF